MKPRPSTLAKYLQMVRQPVFLLDAEAKLLFCNRALEEWTGCESEKLLGSQLRYRGPASRLKHEIVAAALAPPPETLNGSLNGAPIGKRARTLLVIDRVTSQSRRYAEYIPLSPGGMLVLVDENEATENDQGQPDSTERQAAADLHQTLLSFRRRQAGRFRWDRMIGASQQMQRVRRLARLVVDSTASVLIFGESGTGKGHLASAIHYGQSGEQPGALVPVDCGVLDEELIASTVYAFRKRFRKEETTRRHTLLFSDAHLLPGTLFPIIADFATAAASNQRIIASSTLPVQEWTNHEALPILLGTVRIELPPLRRRREDIPLLAQLFLENNNEDVKRQRAGFTSDALDALALYDWPGNIAELEHFVTEAHARSGGTLVSAADLPDQLRYSFEADVQASSQKRSDEGPIHLESFLEKTEKELIERALHKAQGNKSLAASLLGVTRPRLYRRLEYFGLLTTEDTQRND